MKTIKKMLFAFSLTMILFFAFPISVLGAVETPLTVRESIIPYSHEYEWLYKVENGQLYKRLYNKTTGQWVGEWIPAN